MLKGILSLLFVYHNAFGAIPSIRVRVAQGLSKLKVSGLDIQRTIEFDQSKKTFNGRKSIGFNCRKFSMDKRFQKLRRKSVKLASLSSSTGLVTLNNEKYDGNLVLLSSPRSDSCDVVQETNLESYLSSLLAKEMNAAWPIEALKAQAVAARTYALEKMRKKNKGYKYYDIENSEKHQVGGNFFDATIRTVKATKETQGEVLLNSKGEVRPIFFHASCGGRTLRPEHVWNNSLKSYRMVDCKQCQGRTNKLWGNGISILRFEKYLDWAYRKKIIRKKYIIKSLSKLKFMPSKAKNVNFRFYIGESLVSLPKSSLRRYFGRFTVPSNYFSIRHDLKRNRLFLNGNGLGHGVGLCQIGALDLAKKGMGYKEILAHYFPEHKLKKVYK